MKRFVAPSILLIVILGVVIVSGWLAVVGVQTSIAWVLDQESQVAAAIIATSGPLFAGIIAYVVGQQRTKSREIAEAHRPNKIELYNEFLTEMIKFLHNFRAKQKPPKNPNEDPQLVAFFSSFTKNLMLWGSPAVINAWSKFRSQAEGGTNALLNFDDLIRAIRRDLGHRNWMLQRGQLVKLILSDPKNVDSLLKK